MKNKFNIGFGFLGQIGNFVSDNVSSFTLAGALLGLAASLYASYKAASEVSEIREKYDKEIKEIESSGLSDDEKAKEIKEAKALKNMRVLSAEKWAIGLGVASGGCMIATKVLDGIAITGLTTLAYAERDKLKKFADNAKEMIGEEKFKQLEDKTLEDLVLENFVGKSGPIAMKLNRAKGQVFIDSNTGYIFQINRDDLLDAFEWGKNERKRNTKLSQEKWFEHLGLPPRPEGKYREWNSEIEFEPYIGKREICGMTVDSIEYKYQPQPPDPSEAPWSLSRRSKA